MKPTKEQIIEWARTVAGNGTVDPVSTSGIYITLTPDEFQRFAALATAAGYAKGQEDMRETIIQEIPGGSSVDPQWVCDMIRSLPIATPSAIDENPAM